jgi:hypothetical protein
LCSHAGIIDNRESIIIIVPKKKNQIELLLPLTVSILDFLMETAEEIILSNPRRYKNKYQALYTVTYRWTLLTGGLCDESHLIGEEEEDKEKGEINQLNDLKAEFGINLLTDPMIVVVN